MELSCTWGKLCIFGFLIQYFRRGRLALRILAARARSASEGRIQTERVIYAMPAQAKGSSYPGIIRRSSGEFGE